MPTTDTFEAMLTAHLPRLRAYAMMLTRNRSQADDLLQETAYRALRFRSKFIIGTNFSAWTYQILRNEFITTVRRAKRAMFALDDAPAEFIAKRPDQEDVILTQEVLRAMGKLRLPEREILMLISAGDLTYEETAEHLKVSLGTVRSRLWRARKNLASLVMGDDRQDSAVPREPGTQAPRLRVLADGLT